MSAQPKLWLTPDEYLAMERRATTKSEYFAGKAYALAGASEAHNLIAGNVFASLHGQLRRRPCKVYPSDMRVKVSPTGLYTYPDVSVVCGSPRFDDKLKDTLLNPTLVVEVLSEATETYDRGDKFAHYRTLESLREYVLIAQDTYRVELYVLQSDRQWRLSEANGLDDTIELASIQCRLALSDVYDKVDLAGGAGP